MSKSPIILNKKELDKRKADVYRVLNNEKLLDRDEKKLKLQAKREVKLINEELKKRNNVKEQSYDSNIILNELMDFIKDTTKQ